MAIIEGETQFRASVRDLPRAITLSTLTAGLVAALMGVASPTLLVYHAGHASGFTAPQLGSWFFAIFVGGGLFSVLLALLYRQPMTGAYSIAGAALLVQTLPRFGLHEAVGAYVLAGLSITALALTGWFERLMKLIPPEIVMGMLAGVLLRFGVDIFPQLVKSPLLVGPTLLAYAVAWRFPRWLPPIFVALAVGVAMSLFTHTYPAAAIPLAFTVPEIYAPAFSVDGFLSIALPLVLLALSSQNATGIGVLWAHNYKAPINAITLATGLFSLVTAPLAGHGVNLATPMTALCADPSAHEDPQLRYGAAVVTGVLWIVCGCLGLTLVMLIDVLPQGLILTIAGLGLVPVILQSLTRSFSANKHRFGCLFALLIAASNAQWLGVGAAFWALVLASIASLLIDRDWHLMRAADKPASGEGKSG
jgi:benzoate membrane transport protein